VNAEIEAAVHALRIAVLVPGSVILNPDARTRFAGIIMPVTGFA